MNKRYGLKRLLPALLIGLLLCPLFAEAAQMELSGGVVTGVKNASVLADIPAVVFYSDESAGEVAAYLEYYQSVIEPVTGFVSMDGTEYETELSVEWTVPDIDPSVPGEYEMTGQLCAPAGCVFADGVLTKIVVPCTVRSAEETYAVASLVNVGLCTSGLLLAPGDTEVWERELRSLQSVLKSVYGLTADGVAAALDVDIFDTDGVDLYAPGEYEIVIRMKLSEEKNTLSFSLPDDLAVIRVPVKITRPEDFELWIQNVTNSAFVVETLSFPSGSASLLYTESDASLSDEQLTSARWEVYPDGGENLSLPFLKIYRSSLTQGRYYYFRFRSGDALSAIVMIRDLGEQYESATIGGDRDGGGSSGNTPGDTVQPSPDPGDSGGGSLGSDGQKPDGEPDPGDGSGSSGDVGTSEGTGSGSAGGSSQTGSSSGADAGGSSQTDSGASDAGDSSQADSGAANADGSSPVMESFTEDGDTLYGVRLRLMRESSGGSAVFSKHGVQMTLSPEALDLLDVGDQDRLDVRILWDGLSSLSVSVQKNGAEAASLPDTLLTLPYAASDPDGSFFLTDEEGELLSEGSYDAESGLLTFTVHRGGTFCVTQELSLSAGSGSSGVVSGSSPSLSGGARPGGVSHGLSAFAVASALLGLLAVTAAGALCFIRRRRCETR
ncbi:MAG: hypothetical protein Q4C82_04220 [Eubacteriales bacterium]|nr:hypothetical protein [Eubacteriales bacterium]